MVSMKLSELAFACSSYGRMTDYDHAFLQFLQATGNSPNLNDSQHRKALLVWLNQWGCRHFAIKDHELASEEILAWYNEYSSSLISIDINLWELTESEFTAAGAAYKSLSNRIASYRTIKENTFPVSIGPTCAAKILFANRPKAFLPWDAPIRESLGYDGSHDSFVSYLKSVKSIIEELAISCNKNGFDLSELPERIGRPNSTIPKLIDEYYWVTITRNLPFPEPSNFQQ